MLLVSESHILFSLFFSFLPSIDDHSRVKLRPLPGKDSKHSDYINANYVDVSQKCFPKPVSDKWRVLLRRLNVFSYCTERSWKTQPTQCGRHLNCFPGLSCCFHLTVRCVFFEGLQQSEGLHRHPGTVKVHVWRLLEDDLGTKHWNHCHDYKPRGERKSKNFYSCTFIQKITWGASAVGQKLGKAKRVREMRSVLHARKVGSYQSGLNMMIKVNRVSLGVNLSFWNRLTIHL